MNCKAFFTIISVCAIVISSCCKIETHEYPDGNFSVDGPGMNPTKAESTSEYAFVRLGLYETIENHTVSITRIWIEGSNTGVNIPEIGTNIISSGTISGDFLDPTFDSECGEYHNVIPGAKASDIRIHFDATVTCGSNGVSIPVEDATVTIKASQANWEKGRAYSYVVRIDESTLGLKSISFNPSVTDYVSVNVSF